MNTLTWLLLLAGMKDAFIVLSFSGGCLLLGIWVVRLLTYDNELVQQTNKPRWWLYAVFGVLLSLAIALPNTQTVVLMAVSEVGGKTVQHPAFQKALEKYLRD